jgi:hypothetical protein
MPIQAEIDASRASPRYQLSVISYHLYGAKLFVAVTTDS